MPRSKRDYNKKPGRAKQPNSGINFLVSPFFVGEATLTGDGKDLAANGVKVISHQWFLKRHKVFGAVGHMLALILVAGVVIAPIFSFWAYQKICRTKGRVLGETTTAIAELEGAKQGLSNFNLADSRDHFLRSYQSLENLNQEINRAGVAAKLLMAVIPQSASYYHLLQAGLHLSQVGYVLSGTDLNSLNQILKDGEPTALIQKIEVKLKTARPEIELAAQELEQVKIEDLPSAEQPRIAELQTQVYLATAGINQLINACDSLSQFLGADNWRRYLVLFQNNLEMRPTGGFISAAALVDLDRGRIKQLEVPPGGAYDYNFGLSLNRASPHALHLINPRWEFQDCNWFPDARLSAKQCARFFEESTGASVDGVITINLPAVIEILKLAGPIVMSDYGIIIDSENFITFTQSLVESREARASGRPKQFLADLAPLLIEKMEAALANPDQIWQLVTALINALQSKDLLIYSTNQQTQSWFDEHDWSGGLGVEPNIPPAKFIDHLTVNVATVNGGKSDYNIKQQVVYRVEMGADGYLVGNVAVKRTHQGARQLREAFSTQAAADFNYLTAQPNLSYIRLYVPAGATLVNVTGDVADISSLLPPQDLAGYIPDEFYSREVRKEQMNPEMSNTVSAQESGFAVFANYMLVEPGQSGEIFFRYRLPIKWEANGRGGYQLLAEKQPGIESDFTAWFEDSLLYQSKLEHDEIIY